MKIQFRAVGKVHESYVKPGIEDFTKRISNYYPADWRLISAAKQTTGSTEQEIKKQESVYILSTLHKDDYVILLDEKGSQLTSPGLGAFIEQRAVNSVKQLVFLIGGAFGVHETIVSRANYCWSLSSLVFPHQLVRLILAEQVYRACTIIRNEKYHHI